MIMRGENGNHRSTVAHNRDMNMRGFLSNAQRRSACSTPIAQHFFRMCLLRNAHLRQVSHTSQDRLEHRFNQHKCNKIYDHPRGHRRSLRDGINSSSQHYRQLPYRRFMSTNCTRFPRSRTEVQATSSASVTRTYHFFLKKTKSRNSSSSMKIILEVYIQSPPSRIFLEGG